MVESKINFDKKYTVKYGWKLIIPILIEIRTITY